jgi:hypothetical protein
LKRLERIHRRSFPVDRPDIEIVSAGSGRFKHEAGRESNHRLALVDISDTNSIARLDCMERARACAS